MNERKNFFLIKIHSVASILFSQQLTYFDRSIDLFLRLLLPGTHPDGATLVSFKFMTLKTTAPDMESDIDKATPRA